MYSIIITAYRESETIGPAIEAFLPQLSSDAELIVVCPDAETTAVIQHYAQLDARVQHCQDPQHGKPAALNIGLKAAKHDIVILTDGDVHVGEEAVAALLAPFADEKVGAVTGQPKSTSPRTTELGYWSHLLVHGAHRERTRRDQAGKFLLCSGYLFAFRKSLMPIIPPDVLAEDAVISHSIGENGWQIRYAPAAKVFVKYPTTYADWLLQKVRSAGGYAQDVIRKSPLQMRTPWLEAIHGTQVALQFAQNGRERWWTVRLFAARMHLWWLVFWNVRVLKRPLSQLWQRVETTK